MRIVKVTAVAATALLLALSVILLNLRFFSRTVGFDEAYYYSWVDNWEENPIYYPHHLLFGPTSVAFQRAFEAATGITNTAFIQRFKNTLVFAVGLALLFVIFVARSKRYLLALIFVALIGVSGMLWIDSMHHETAAIPAMVVGIAISLLVFYNRIRRPLPLIIGYSVLLALAILLHQMYLLALMVGPVTFLFTRAKGEKRLAFARNIGRALIHLAVTLAIVVGTYFYVGFSKLDLRMTDNPDGTQIYMGVTINGNFLRYFYLLTAYGIWGEEPEEDTDTAVLAIDGYGSTFVPYFWPLHVSDQPDDPVAAFPSNLTFRLLLTLGCILILGAGPALARYGSMYFGTLIWLAAAAAFITWWEPRQMEHWIYLNVLTCILAFLGLSATIEMVPLRLPRSMLLAASCFVMATFAVALFAVNLETWIAPRSEFSRAAGIPSSIWRQEYSMDELKPDYSSKLSSGASEE